MKKVWIEIDKKAARNNFDRFQSLLDKKTELWAVVKSNAYGHGLQLVAKLFNSFGIDGFCVDSLVEGMKLRTIGITKPILVLGPTLPHNSSKSAYDEDITLTISSREALKEVLQSRYIPKFYIKVDTGMHRQGFDEKELKKVFMLISKKGKDKLIGMYSHFASANDTADFSFVNLQYSVFLRMIDIAKKAGFQNIRFSAAATGATLMDKKFHFDAVRIGAGLYGYWPSSELRVQKSHAGLKPLLSWKSIISEIKTVPKGAFIGYDLTEKTVRTTKLGIIPIGYWHGFSRGLSRIGEVLVSKKRARVLGRVSMDLIAVDLTGISAHVGTIVTLLGKEGKEIISAEEMAGKLKTSHYEVITRINPLIERVLVTS